MPAKGQKVKESVKRYLSDKYKGEGNPNWKGGTSIYIYKGRKAWNKGTKGLTKTNKTSFKKGNIPKNYKGGICFFTRDRRWVIYCRDNSKIHYARAILECHLKRMLKSDEIVHHINEDSTDDRIENLEIVSSSKHINIHRNKLEKARGIC